MRISVTKPLSVILSQRSVSTKRNKDEEDNMYMFPIKFLYIPYRSCIEEVEISRPIRGHEGYPRSQIGPNNQQHGRGCRQIVLDKVVSDSFY